VPRPQPQYAIQLNETQVAELTHVSLSYTAPFAEVQRARILLLAHHHPDWSNPQIAQTVGCCLDMVKVWRQRWQTQGNLEARLRSGAPRQFSALVRTQIIALACSPPADHGKVWKRWSGEKLARVAGEQGIVPAISPSTIRRWLHQDKIKPWRYHSWQRSTDPQFVEKATPVLDLYEQAQVLASQREAVCCVDEKTSIQARDRASETRPAVPGHPVQIADRYQRQGALQLFCALMVASGLTFARCYAKKYFAHFQSFLKQLFASARCRGLKVLHLILDNGSTHAPKQLGRWIGSLALSFQVRIYWLPTGASWLDQVEIIFSKVQRDVLTPNDFASTRALQKDLLAYLRELNRHPKPIQWTYTKEKLIAKFRPPQEEVEEAAA
jgi:transposase